MCGKIGHLSKDCRSKETSAVEAGDELTDGTHRNGKHRFERIGDRSGSDCFGRVLRTTTRCSRLPAKAKSYRPASGKLLPNLGARKVSNSMMVSDGSISSTE